MQDQTDHLLDLFARMGEIQVRRMFGGYGVFRDGLMFALVSDEALYLKADPETRRFFEERGLPQFTYEKKGKRIGMSYFLAPDEIFDDPREAAVWGERAIQAALRSHSGGG
jgi:DNA transformation protein